MYVSKPLVCITVVVFLSYTQRYNLSDTLILSVQLVLKDTEEFIEYKLIGRLDKAATKLAKIANRIRSQFYHGFLNDDVDCL